MSLRKRIKAFLRDDELRTEIDGIVQANMSVLLSHIDQSVLLVERVSVQVAALDAKKLAEVRAMPAKPRTWAQTKERLEGGMAESKA